MRIIPVIDIKDGVVVRGMAGNRREYRPIVSRLCDDPSAKSVARGLRKAFGFDECYIADLDAITGSSPSWKLYDDVIATSLRPWIDAGTGDVERTVQVARYFESRGAAGRVIVGLESLADLNVLREIVAAVGAERLVFSLDLKHGLPLIGGPAWSKMSPEAIAERAIECGVRSIIVLDLAGVGMAGGVPTLELCRHLRADYPTLELITGGGVRNIDDLRSVHAAGCGAVLIASALHDGSITWEMMCELRR